jgi:hypothetical protein
MSPENDGAVESPEVVAIGVFESVFEGSAPVVATDACENATGGMNIPLGRADVVVAPVEARPLEDDERLVAVVPLVPCICEMYAQGGCQPEPALAESAARPDVGAMTVDSTRLGSSVSHRATIPTARVLRRRAVRSCKFRECIIELPSLARKNALSESAQDDRSGTAQGRDGPSAPTKMEEARPPETRWPAGCTLRVEKGRLRSTSGAPDSRRRRSKRLPG